MTVVWLRRAQQCLVLIGEPCAATASGEFGRGIVRRIVHTATTLIKSAYLVRPSDDVDGVRQLHMPRLPFLLPYRVVEDRAEILRVFREAQDRPSTWQEPEDA